ncbi:cupredoxin domain-containing protein [Streptomyces sp. NPDC001941]|uniref:cupredoxin domain-containing protein n=1 Tax=Streptomyces sp. NPDC001941 TaxID=3154659 RepID=UPI00331F8257
MPFPIRRAALVLASSLAVLAPGAASAAGPTPPPHRAPARLVVENFGFSPAVLKVSPGQQVTVVNHDDAPHTVTSDGPAAFDTGRIAPGGTATFTAPVRRGSHPYVCDIHQFMSGRLDVR